MAKVLKSPWVRLLGLAVASGVAVYAHSQIVKDAFYVGKRVGIDQSAGSVDSLLKQTTVITEDLDNDGLEDLCLVFPPGSSDHRSKAICRIDYDGDCIQDTVYLFLDQGRTPEIVNSNRGEKHSGQCTIPKKSSWIAY